MSEVLTAGKGVSNQPTRVVVAGDWHGNTSWARGVIQRLPDLLPDEWPRTMLHLGDFGVWPGRAGRAYLNAIQDALYEAGAQLWFIDGNHEDFTQLTPRLDPTEQTASVALLPRVTWLPRGHRWVWHDRTWLAMGGAVSVDKVFRREGLDWWPDERITIAQGVRAERGGRADVMVCHDAPAPVPLRLPPTPRGWDVQDIARAERHRDVLQGIVDEVRPQWLMHGHYHLEHDTTVEMRHGPVRVTGLDMDESTRGNYRVLNVETMTWEP